MTFALYYINKISNGTVSLDVIFFPSSTSDLYTAINDNVTFTIIYIQNRNVNLYLIEKLKKDRMCIYFQVARSFFVTIILYNVYLSIINSNISLH